MNRYVLTSKHRGYGRPGKPMLSNGWTTTELVFLGAKTAEAGHVDRAFTFEELIDAVRFLMSSQNARYLGYTTDTRRYKDDADRVVRGRFGDLYRAGVFAEAR